MQVIILEDEPLAGEKLQHFLERYDSAIQVAAILPSITATVEWLQEHPQPDLILSDIELLDGNIFSLYQQLSLRCPVIFCTSHDQFLLHAFETNGIAYLIKPFSFDKFRQAMDKYALLRRPLVSDELVRQVAEQLRHTHQPVYRERFTVRVKDGIILLAVEDIQYFYSEYSVTVAVDKQQQKHLLSETLDGVMELVDPDMFFRVNRGEIIRLDSIAAMTPYFGDRLSVRLKGITRQFVTSTSRTAAFRKWICR
ncbi:LytTR family DNA-binding domain-containing protein [Chitinophaga pendula]|uniref:LytR/AlgR family response regulator transcription factor n=1 Tax=Chitinophaga TaxID=79328 RepID=UPI000BAFEFE8|nr:MULTISPECIES: LytTR family DNA-binding domain-containing protein [Chitinophaga]ASZ14402.1 DNA-binding response regulator [Chitinophaga sp. MD30]UCJ07943.1 LytTR family DNA-binding domain-containing protein [Chitinophaga pendula]